MSSIDPNTSVDLTSATILLVDDNLQNLELMQAYLEDLGVELRTAMDGIAAIEAMEADPPDLVLLDVMMPRMSGCTPNLHLKARGRDNNTKKIKSGHGNLRCHEICDCMASPAFKMTIFSQFRHALTRHDPKTYLS